MERAVLLANGRPLEPRHFLLENDDWPLFEEDEADYASEENGSAAGSHGVRPAQDNALAATDPAALYGDQNAARATPQDSVNGTSDRGVATGGAVMPLHEMERIMILKGLEATSGNRAQAADLLGFSVRTLRNRLNEYRAAGRPID